MNIFISVQVEDSPLPKFNVVFVAVGEGWGGAIMPHPKRSTPKTMHKAGKLRKELTPAERKLWAHIRNDQLGVGFRRQHAIGNYIPDFVCIKKRLIIELDGSQHLEQVGYDSERTAFLESKGYRVLRFWNNDVMKNIDFVLTAIWNAVHENADANGKENKQ